MEDFEDNENIAFDDVSRIHPWNAIVQDLINEFGGNNLLFEELKNLSKTQIGPENFRNIYNAQEYFECIKNNFEDESDMISFLINVTDYMQLHVDCGRIKVSKRIKEYKQKLEEVRRERQKQGVYSDKDFVGRKRDIEEIVGLLSEQNPAFKGVSSCGQGGMGKTSLAREVCYRLKCSRIKWIPKKIELREVSSLTDMLRATLSTLKQSNHSVDVDDLKQQLFGYLKSCDRKIVLFFDNIDDIMAKEKNAIISFFKELLFLLNDMDNCMIRVIITSREKLLSEDELLTRVLKSIFPRTEQRLNEMVKEYELKPLTDSESLELFEKCTKGRVVPIKEEDASVIVQLCGNCPLAIRTISDTLRYNLISAQDIITRIRGSLSTDTFGVTDCLHQSFCTLDKIYQFKLIQITVFKTAGFTTEAAMFVLDISETFTAKTEMLYLKSRHLIEIEDLTLLADDSDSEFRNRDNVRYSIHPLVFKYLQGRKEHDTELFKEPMQNANIKFLVYYEKKINDIGREQFQNYLKAQKIISDHSSHIISFYHMLHEYPHSLVTEHKDAKRSDVMLSNKRIGDLADILLNDQKKFKLLNKWISAAERDGDALEAMFWKIEKASKFFDMDRTEHAKEVLAEIEPELFCFDGNHREETLCFVQAMFYFLRGRCLVTESKTAEGIENFKNAKRLFKTKQVKRFYRDCLANCYNSIGSAYYNKSPQPDIVSARKYHEKALKKASEMSTENMNCDIPAFLTNIGTCFFREGISCLNFNKEIEADAKFNKAKEYFDKAIRLDVEMKLDKSKSYVQKLTNRADLHLLMKNYEAALKDATTALKLGKEILRQPHVQLTLTAHRTGEIQRNYAREEYKKDKDHAYEMFECAAEIYKEVAAMIKDGGLPLDHEEYPRIKHNHLDILKQLRDGEKMKIYIKFYEDFENRKFAHISEMKRSMKKTEKYFPTRDELDMGEDSSSSSSSDEANSDVSDTESSSIDDVPEKTAKLDRDGNKKHMKRPGRNKKTHPKRQMVHKTTKEVSIKEQSIKSNIRKRKRDEDKKSQRDEDKTSEPVESVQKKTDLLDYCHII